MKVKLGVVGCGGIAQLVHIPSLKRIKEVELVAVCDIYGDVAKGVATKYGIEKYYTDYREMFEKEELDGIINTTWPAAHAEVTIEAAKAGINVFVEKPMAVTVEECKEMIRACKENGVRLMVGFMKRFDPGLAWVKGEIDRGELGEVFAVNSWYCDCKIHMKYVRAFISEFIRPSVSSPSTPKPLIDRHLNKLLTHGIHHADLLRWIGGEVKSVTSHYSETPDRNYISTSILEFESGATGYFQLCGAISGDWDEGLVVYGSKGTVRAKIRFPYFKWRSEVTIFKEDLGGYISRLFPFRDMYLAELEHFVQCIIHNKKPLPNGYDGLKAQELIYAIYRSAKEGRKITLS